MENPLNRGVIAKAARQEERVRFHVDAAQSDRENTVALRDLYAMVDKRMPKDKARMFKNYLDFPLDTVSLTGEAFNLLEKVYDGRDRVIQYHFIEKDYEEDWNQYQKQIKNAKFWREDAWGRLKSRFNSVMVVDMPIEGGVRPEPYVYFVDISMVYDYGGADDQFDWIIYRTNANTYVHIDDTHYQVFNLDNDSDVYATEELLSLHDLGRCPARFFISDKLQEDQKAVMRSPLSGEVGNLNYLQYIITNKKMADSYGANPIYWQYTKECDFTRHVSGRDEAIHSCRGGVLVDQEGLNVMRGKEPEKCPVCEESSLTGAGSLIEVDPPSHKDDPIITPPAGVIQGDVAILKFLVDEEERRKRSFITAVTGTPSEVTSDQAVNVTQVMSLMEQGKAAILKVKRCLEEANQWADRTICELRYGRSFINCSINYGTEFFMVGADMLMKMYIEARAKKLDGTILDGLLDQYYETRYRHNPEKFHREMMISHIDPFRHLWEDAVTSMYEKGSIKYELYMMKVNLTSLIKRFERENGDITHFGSRAYDEEGVRISFGQRIELIRSAMIGYITADKPLITPIVNEDD